MNGKRLGIAPLFLIAVLAVSMAGAVALWYDTLTIDASVETGELDWGFDDLTYGSLDPCGLTPSPDRNAFPPDFDVVMAPEGKDVGCTYVNIIDTDSDGDFDYLNVTINNAYPYYYTKVFFDVENTGTIPLKIWRVMIILDNGTTYNFTELNADVIELGQTEAGLFLDLNNDGQADILMLWGDNFGAQLEPGEFADMSLHIVVLQEAPQNSTLHFQIGLDAVQWNEYDDVVGGS